MKLKLEHLKEHILTRYDEIHNISKISKELGEHQQAVTNVLKKYLKKTSFRPSIRNIDYFSIIDSHEKAYIVGFIAADGSLVKKKKGNSAAALTITLKYEDRSILEFIKSQLGNEHSLKIIKRKSSYNKDKEIHHCRFVLANKKIEEDLNKLGIIPNKSLIIQDIIKNIPLEFRDSFIIGYFDGDGSVSKNNTIKRKYVKNENKIKEYPCHNLIIQIRGTKSFLEGVCEHLNISKCFIKKYDSTYRLYFSNKKDVVKFFNCYKNLNFFLQRKYDIFLERINHHSYDKYK